MTPCPISFFAGIASPTEAAAVGAVEATFLTVVNKKFNMRILQEVMHTTVRLTCMVFIILCGAAAFGLVFRGLGGDGLVRDFLGGFSHKYSHGAVLAIVVFFPKLATWLPDWSLVKENPWLIRGIQQSNKLRTLTKGGCL